MTDECWRAVPGHEGSYEVSNLGGVRSLDRTIIDASGRNRRLRGQALSVSPPKDDYIKVHLGGRGRTVHTLVLEAFVGPRPPGLEGCHKNGNRKDNRLSNLRWDTRSSNVKDTTRHGRNVLAERQDCGPGGHRLVAPNLTESAQHHGRRQCLACKRGRDYVKTHPSANLRAESDRFYAELMSPGYRPRVKAGGLPRGVEKRGNRYRARIGVNYKMVDLGGFDTVDEASAAYEEARRER